MLCWTYFHLYWKLKTYCTKIHFKNNCNFHFILIYPKSGFPRLSFFCILFNLLKCSTKKTKSLVRKWILFFNVANKSYFLDLSQEHNCFDVRYSSVSVECITEVILPWRITFHFLSPQLKLIILDLILLVIVQIRCLEELPLSSNSRNIYC